MKCGAGPEVDEKMKRDVGREKGDAGQTGCSHPSGILPQAPGPTTNWIPGLEETQIWRKNTRNHVIRLCC